MNADDSMVRIERRILLGRKLGSGGMGRVVDGFSPDLGQNLAVKILHPECAEQEELRKRFEEEVSIMASIDHPGSLPIYGTVEGPGGSPAYVMKKIEGQTLGQLLGVHDENPYDLPRRSRLIHILLDVCETMACAHEIGIVHRDLKPDNILIDRHGSVYVIDWGLAKRHGTSGSASSITRTIAGTVMGSPGYLSPEQAEGLVAETSPASDVFSLGTILYEILTGRRPFHSETIREEVLGTVHKDPAPPHTARRLVPRSISAVCMKALEKHSRDRYPSAAEMSSDLRAFLEGRRVSARQPNLMERYYYASRASPVKTMAISAISAAVLALLVIVGGQYLIDHRLTEKTLDELELIDADLAENRKERLELRERLRGQNLDPDERTRLLQERDTLDAGWLLGEMEAIRLLGSIQSLYFVSSSERLEESWKRRTISFCESAIGLDFPAVSFSITDEVLERVALGKNKAQFTETEMARIKELHEEAVELMQSPSEFR